MSGTADPWEPPHTAALSRRVVRTPRVERSGGPERIYDAQAADKKWRRRPVGFTANIQLDPLLWEGDNA